MVPKGKIGKMVCITIITQAVAATTSFLGLSTFMFNEAGSIRLALVRWDHPKLKNFVQEKKFSLGVRGSHRMMLCDELIISEAGLYKKLMAFGIAVPATKADLPEIPYYQNCLNQIINYNEHPNKLKKNKIYHTSKIGGFGVFCSPKIIARMAAVGDIHAIGKFNCPKNAVSSFSVVPKVAKRPAVIFDEPLPADVIDTGIHIGVNAYDGVKNVKIKVGTLVGVPVILKYSGSKFIQVLKPGEFKLYYNNEGPHEFGYFFEKKMQKYKIGVDLDTASETTGSRVIRLSGA